MIGFHLNQQKIHRDTTNQPYLTTKFGEDKHVLMFNKFLTAVTKVHYAAVEIHINLPNAPKILQVMYYVVSEHWAPKALKC